jgi:multidrug efflux pump subunit AcrA (membrane-fusion protein)
MDGDVVAVPVKHGQMVKKGDVLVQMQNFDLDGKISAMRGQLDSATQQLGAIKTRLSDSKLDKTDQGRLLGEKMKIVEEQKSYTDQLRMLEYKKSQLTVTSPVDGQIVTWQVYDLLIFRPVQLGALLMTVEEPQGPWELEVQMPEDRMGFINDARHDLGDPLTVTYITATNPGVKHIGKVKEVHLSAEVRGEEGNTVLLRVAIDKNDLTDLRSGATVTAKVYCGRAPIGYVWLHDLVSFVQSKILFRVF